MGKVFLGIGSNIGDKEENFRRALCALREDPEIKIKKESSRYITKAVGGPIQEDYLNGVVEIETEIIPCKLIKKIKTIEKNMGRQILPKDYPRIIDIDILLYDDIVMDSENLVIPHPRMHMRSFVLKGLLEVSPHKMHPILNKTVKELFEDLIGKG